MTPSDLESLNRELWIAMGAKACDIQPPWTDVQRWIPPFATSIDAQKAPGGPEELARERGLVLEVTQMIEGWNVEVRTSLTLKRVAFVEAFTEAEARARALLQALKEAV